MDVDESGVGREREAPGRQQNLQRAVFLLQAAELKRDFKRLAVSCRGAPDVLGSGLTLLFPNNTTTYPDVKYKWLKLGH